MLKLTVVICTFNAEVYLDGCIKSLANQKRDFVRVVIIDGASVDKTLDIARRHAEVVDTIISEADEGVYDAMNKALNIVDEGWVLYLGADDRLMPNAIEKIESILMDVPSDGRVVLYGDVYRPSGNVLYDGSFGRYRILRRNICQQGILYPASLLRVGPFDLRFKINADHIKNVEFFYDKRVTMRYVPVCISYFEDVSDGLSRDGGDANLIAARRRIAREKGGVLPFVFCCAIDLKEKLRKVLF